MSTFRLVLRDLATIIAIVVVLKVIFILGRYAYG